MNKLMLLLRPSLRGGMLILASSLIGSAPLSAAYILNFFPASDYNSNTAAMNAALGITGYQTDSFE